jgi:hypothetical protein
MAEATEQSVEGEEPAPAPRRNGRRWLIGLLAIAGLGLGGLWLARTSIADRIILGQLQDLGLPATYKIERIGLRRQVLTDIVIGDPSRPDLTIERAEIAVVPTLGLPTIGRITLVRPRLYGSLRNGQLSFGSLDPVLFAKSDEPFRLPDLDLALRDGRARIETDFGTVGAKADGQGNLRDGYSGILAVVAPRIAAQGCVGSGASAFGRITIADALPRFDGPLRLATLDCPAKGASLRGAALTLDAHIPTTFDRTDGRFALSTGAVGWQGTRAAGASASGKFSFAGGDLTASFQLAGRQLEASAVGARQIGIKGLIRSRSRFAMLEGEGELSGSGLVPGKGAEARLAMLERSGDGSPAAPLARQIHQALLRESRGSEIRADFSVRRNGAVTSLIIPRAAIKGSSGGELARLSRFELSIDDKLGLRVAGNFVTGGPGLPRIEGQIERAGSGTMKARLSLAEYSAGDSRVALPRLTVVQSRTGELGFAGEARLSGVLPGGRVDGLVLPIDGNWSARAGLAAWRRCMPVRFDSLRIANLALDARTLTLCPGREGAMLRSNARGTRLSAGTARMALSGRLGSTPMRVDTGAIGLAWPGMLAARDIAVSLGAKDDPSTVKLATVSGRLGAVMAGRFTGAEVRLNTVPLDVLDAEADWRFADGALAVTGGTLRVEDRQADDRFRPLLAREAILGLRNDDFTATALLREPKSDRPVVNVDIAHDLSEGRGRALLDVPGLVFDRRMQPDTLTALALGVIANAKGTVSGTGRIDWNGDKVTSGGRFTTPGLDFAAAFGPVEGVSGTVEFVDLLDTVTAPDQRLKIASINPGIEVLDGTLSFAMLSQDVLVINGARWPFLDGELELQPSRMVLGASEVRRYTLAVENINAARFIEHLELANLSATGYFDGTLPLVFDEDGGHIVGGMLTSRPPGGNLSYVGELTYKDLGTMGNFAFQALRSLDFRKMQIGMDGNLEGDIITRIRLDGVRQGATAKRNFITQRFAKLPIQFNINIQAPFQRLVTTFKSIYDPAYVRDPRELGIVDGSGQPVRQESRPPLKLPDIQPPESRDRP